jgi:hypothetical protein
MPRPDPENSRKREMERAQRQGDPPPDAVNEVLAQTFQNINNILSDGMLASDSLIRAEGARIRRKVQVEQAAIDSRDLAIEQAEEVRGLREELQLVREEVRQLREESDAGSRMALLPSWWAVLIAVLALIVAVLGLLLAR